MADVNRLVQVDELAGLPQPVEELAEVFLHYRAPRGVVKTAAHRSQ